MWAFQIVHDRPLRRVDWACVLGWKLGVWVLHQAHFFFGLGEWVCEPIFQTLSVAPQPLCTVCVGKGCNVSRIGCDFHVSALCWVSLGFVASLCLVIMMTFMFSCSFLPLLSVCFCFFCKRSLTVCLVCP